MSCFCRTVKNAYAPWGRGCFGAMQLVFSAIRVLGYAVHPVLMRPWAQLFDAVRADAAPQVRRAASPGHRDVAVGRMSDTTAAFFSQPVFWSHCWFSVEHPSVESVPYCTREEIGWLGWPISFYISYFSAPSTRRLTRLDLTAILHQAASCCAQHFDHPLIAVV